MANRNNMAGAFIAGAAVGGVIALLIAPASGRETREKIKEKAGEAKDRADAEMNHLRDFVKVKGQQVKDVAGKMRSKGEVSGEDSMTDNASM